MPDGLAASMAPPSPPPSRIIRAAKPFLQLLWTLLVAGLLGLALLSLVAAGHRVLVWGWR